MKSSFYFHKAPGKVACLPIDRNTREILDDFNSSIHFHQSLSGYSPSPLVHLAGLSGKWKLGPVLVKDESRRFGIQAVKMLGASWAIHCLNEDDPFLPGFCTATDGNHGRSVAWSARLIHKPARIFLPHYTVSARVEAIKKEGAEAIVIDGNYDDAVIAAQEFAGDSGFILVQDMAWGGYERIPALISAGYYTQLAELDRQLQDYGLHPGLVILQTGNGTWPSAVCHYMRYHRRFRKTKIILAEPTDSDCLLESFRNGDLSTVAGSQQTIMAGLNCGTPSSLAWEILKHGADGAMAIPDRYALEAMRSFYYPVKGDPGIEAGESGAAGLGALLALLTNDTFQNLRKELDLKPETCILLFNTEGITDPENFRKLVL